MGLKTQLKKVFPKTLSNYGKSVNSIVPFAFSRNADVLQDIQEKYHYNGDFAEIYAHNKGCLIHKWHHYIPLYDRYCAPFRGRTIRFLEIGVSQGGSLQMWRKYFGNDAIIYGIDIDPNCEQLNGLAAQVRIGSQNDPEFLESVINEMGGIDIVSDDGSHHMKDIAATLKFLFPRLNNGGIYMVEDLHTAYWREFGGGYKSKISFFKIVADLINDMHHWYHANGLKHPEISQYCSGIHVHDSMTVLEKDKTHRPTHSQIE